MVVHKCSHCSFESTHKWVVKRHMESQHNVQQAQVAGGHPYAEPSQGFNGVSVYHPQHTMQSLNLPYPAQHPYNSQPVSYLYGQHPVNLQSPAPYTYHNERHIGGVRGFKRHDDILSVASTYGSVSGTEADTESDSGSVTESVSEAEGLYDSKTLGDVFGEMKTLLEQVFYLRDIADEKIKDYKKYDRETKKYAQQGGAELKITMIEGFDGLDDREEDESDDESDDGQQQKNGQDNEDDTAQSCSCESSSYLSLLENFEDVLEGADLKRYERYQEEYAEQIIEDRDIDEDDSEDDSEDESDDETEETRVKKNLEKKEQDLKKMKAGFKKEGECYFEHCSNRQIDTLRKLCQCLIHDEGFEEVNRKLAPNWGPIMFNVRALADKDLSRPRIRKILLRENVGKGVLNGLLSTVLPLIQKEISK